jgi:hypothetical protein
VIISPFFLHLMTIFLVLLLWKRSSTNITERPKSERTKNVFFVANVKKLRDDFCLSDLPQRNAKQKSKTKKEKQEVNKYKLRPVFQPWIFL